MPNGGGDTMWPYEILSDTKHTKRSITDYYSIHQLINDRIIIIPTINIKVCWYYLLDSHESAKLSIRQQLKNN